MNITRRFNGLAARVVGLVQQYGPSAAALAVGIGLPILKAHASAIQDTQSAAEDAVEKATAALAELERRIAELRAEVEQAEAAAVPDVVDADQGAAVEPVGV